MISRQGLVIIGIGLGLGLLVAVGVGQLVDDFLVGIAPPDPFTYLGLSVLVSLVPSLLIGPCDPIALRYE